MEYGENSGNEIQDKNFGILKTGDESQVQMVKGDVRNSVGDTVDAGMIRGYVETVNSGATSTPSSGRNYETGPPAVENKCRMEKMMCVVHGCAVTRVKTKRQHWVYIEKKKSYGWRSKQTTKLVCTGLGGISGDSIVSSSSDVGSGDLAISEGGLTSTDTILKSESLELREVTGGQERRGDV